jgi:hypothetical protein
VNDSLHLYWRGDQVAKVMRSNKINDRRDLAKRIGQPYSTVCENLSVDWSGRVKTIPILVSICQTFGVGLTALVALPKASSNGNASVKKNRIDKMTGNRTDDDGVIMVTRREAARRLSLSISEIDEARRRGDLGAQRYGSKVLISVVELMRFAAALPSDEP